jgi:hypothetical protein
MPDILKKTFNLCLADGPIPAGNTSSVTQQKPNSLAVQTELTPLVSKTVKVKRD